MLHVPFRVVDVFVCGGFGGAGGRLATTQVNADAHRQTTRVDEVARNVDHYQQCDQQSNGDRYNCGHRHRGLDRSQIRRITT